jgi:hypothetical protein
MTPFKAEMSLQAGDQTLNFFLFFESHYAVEFGNKGHEKLVVVYDLDSKSWTDFDPPRIVRKTDYEEWFRRSEEKSRKSLASTTDVELKKFASAMLDPKFKESSSQDSITLENDVVKYEFSKPISLSDSQRKRFFEYDRLNAYRKAILERKFPPFAQVAVDDVLESRKFVPSLSVMSIRPPIPNPKASVRLSLEYRVLPFDEADKGPVVNAISRAIAMRDANLQKQSGNPKVPQRRTE